MVRLTIVAVMLLAAGCAPSQPPPSEDHVRLAKACVAGGGDKAHCECEATKVDDLLASGSIDPEVAQALILQAEGKEDEADKIMLGVEYRKRFEQPSLVAEEKLKCVAG